MKTMDKVYNLSDFVQCVNAGEVVLMTHTDFYQFESGLSEGKASKSSRPLLRDVYIAEFRKGSYNMHYKLHHDDTFRETSSLKKKKLLILDKPPCEKEERGITSKKKNGVLRNLSSLMPINRRTFYDNLTVNDDVVDLVKEREEHECSVFIVTLKFIFILTVFCVLTFVILVLVY